MAKGQQTGRWIAAGLGLCIVAGVIAVITIRPFSRLSIATPTDPTISTVAQLAAKARQGNAIAVDALLKQLEPKNGGDPSISDAEVKDLVETITGLRAGFLQLAPKSRLTTMTITAAVLDRFAKGNTPSAWIEVLSPIHDLVNSGLGDIEPVVRVGALDVISRAWNWAPNRSLLSVEEQVLADWKQGFHTGVVRRLADAEEGSRAAAVACLGALPMDQAAVPAVAYVDDPSPMVRRQVLRSFASRGGILTEDAILLRTNDSEPDIAKMAEVVLRGRGLTSEQVDLGRRIVHTKPEVRAGLIALLKGRSDIDPVTWLLQLSYDKDELVRTQAIEALATHGDAPEAHKRLNEMAAADTSPTIRATAAKLALTVSDTTAALPPLPGSPSLNPKAN